ncbi:MAG: isoprenylcysteine carboxylmethyltransferase family protein [Gammaproteobacteria bacterium]
MVSTQSAASAPKHSQVVVFPPVIPLSGFLLGALLQAVWPIGLWISGPIRASVRGLGGVLFCFGAAGFAWMVATIKRAGTPIHNSATPTVLVESGPFRMTRNPMYLFGSIAYCGLAMALLEMWSLALLPVVLTVTHYGVVLREEASLAARFGTSYDQYRARVRRWL